MALQLPQGAPLKQGQDLCLCLVTCLKVRLRDLAGKDMVAHLICILFTLGLMVWT